MAQRARFEHIALVVHLDDLLAWDRYLRGPLGGRAALGGVEARAGFQGGQICYPDGGMLEVISWTAEAGTASANSRYLARQGARAALHHLTFLVDDLGAALTRCRAAGYEPMVGRRGRNWEEFFVRERALRPAGLLVQVLRADKDALAAQGWREDWQPFAAQHPDSEPPVHIRGVHLACDGSGAASRLFGELLGAEPVEGALAFEASSMKVWLHDAERSPSFVALSEQRGEPPSRPGLLRAAG